MSDPTTTTADLGPWVMPAEPADVAEVWDDRGRVWQRGHCAGRWCRTVAWGHDSMLWYELLYVSGWLTAQPPEEDRS